MKLSTWRVLDQETGVLWTPPCGLNDCITCVRRKIAKITTALHLVQPAWLLTFENLGTHWREVQAGLTRWRRDLRRSHKTQAESAYFLEPFSNGPGLHAHMLVSSEAEDPTAFWGAARQARLRLGTVDPVKHHGNLAYGLKLARDAATLPSFLAANNGTLIHPSRGFYKVPGGAAFPGGYSKFVDAYTSPPGVQS